MNFLSTKHSPIGYRIADYAFFILLIIAGICDITNFLGSKFLTHYSFWPSLNGFTSFFGLVFELLSTIPFLIMVIYWISWGIQKFTK